MVEVRKPEVTELLNRVLVLRYVIVFWRQSSCDVLSSMRLILLSWRRRQYDFVLDIAWNVRSCWTYTFQQKATGSDWRSQNLGLLSGDIFFARLWVPDFSKERDIFFHGQRLPSWTPSTQRHNPHNTKPQIHCFENLKFCKLCDSSEHKMAWHD